MRKRRQQETYSIAESALERCDGLVITVRPDGWLLGQLVQFETVLIEPVRPESSGSDQATSSRGMATSDVIQASGSSRSYRRTCPSSRFTAAYRVKYRSSCYGVDGLSHVKPPCVVSVIVCLVVKNVELDEVILPKLRPIHGVLWTG